jgi:hypothetical protein
MVTNLFSYNFKFFIVERLNFQSELQYMRNICIIFFVEKSCINILKKRGNNGMTCKKCGSNNVNVQAVSEVKRRGCLAILFYVILLFIPVIGWVALFMLLRGRKSKTESWMVCQDCGYRQKM